MNNGLLMGFFIVCLTAVAGGAVAGDYYAYRDSSGRLVLSNTPPPTSAKTIVKESLPDVSQQEVAEAKARDEAAARENRITSLEQTVDELEYRLRNQPAAPVADYAQPAYNDNGVFVGVSNGFIWPAHRPPRPQPNPRSSTPPSSLPGGIIPPGSLPGGKMG